MEKLLLIDGNSMMFRAYHATVYGQPMKTSSGIPTNALYGFALMLTKALEVIGPDLVLVAFDTGAKTFRHDMYPAYKGTRPPVPEDLIAQMPIVRQYIDALHMRQYEQVGIEADDIIGSAACQNAGRYEVSILSSDRDLLQLIGPHVKLWMMKKGISEMDEVDEARLYQEYQLTPPQVIDWKALAGDASDNIPGVSRIGEKTAIRLLGQYGTLEGVYQHLGELTPRLQQSLVSDRENALLSKTLATIKTDADLGIDVAQCTFQPDSPQAAAFYQRYEMHSFLSRMTPPKPAAPQLKAQAVRTLPAMGTGTLALFLDQGDDGLNGVAVTDGRQAYYLQWDDACHDRTLLGQLAGDGEKVVYDVKRWHHLLSDLGMAMGGRIIDAMIASFLIDCKIKTFDDMCVRYDIKTTVSRQDVYGGQQGLFFDTQRHADYACQLAAGLLAAERRLLQGLKDQDMEDLYWKLELPLAAVLCRMEKAGLRVDTAVLDRIAQQTNAKVEQLQEQIYQQAGHEFNINSTRQLGEVLYDQLHLPSGRKRSTDVKALGHLQGSHPIVGLILEYRKYAKYYSTYAFGLQKYIQPDGKIHTDFNQCVTETGRLSSSEPNLQNISVRSADTQEIRSAFIPEPGCVLVGADYSQVELRILAHMADETNLIQAFKDGMDIHTKTAMDVFDVPREKVTPLLRRQAKAINFGIDYGMTDFGLAERLDIPVGQAHDFIEAYYAKYPKVHEFMLRTVEQCRRDGYVKTLLNRRRPIPEINDSNRALSEFGKRAAMNAPVQGSAADLIKIAMINVDRRLAAENLHGQLVLQIHDELILNVPLAEKDRTMAIVQQEMEEAMDLKVPLVAEATWGTNWLEVK